MPRNGAGTFSLLPGTYGTPSTAISSVKYNSQLDDFVGDLNLARPVSVGGTEATTAAGARTSLGLAIGTDVQAYDTDLAALAVNTANGLWARIGAGTGSARTLTGTAAELTVTNGDGVAGNPTLSLPGALTFTGKTVTGGTFATGAFNGTVGATTPSTGAFTTASLSGGMTVSGGDIILDNATSNFVNFSAVGTAVPSFTTRSVGTKLVLNASLGAAAADYAIGISGNTIWNSVPTTSQQFQWYGGTTLAGALTGTGNFSFVGTLTPGGLVDLSGAAAGQIKFPAAQVASADVNILDDYEEGTWTPTLTFGGLSTGITYSVQIGNYIKIGKLVVLSGRLVLASKGTATGSSEILGLPFTSNSFNWAVNFAFYSAMAGVTTLEGYANSLTLVIRSSAATQTNSVTDANFTATTDIRFTAVYMATA